MCADAQTVPVASDFLNRRVGELAASIPGATRVFRRHRINFCCAGERELIQAIEKRGLDAQVIVDELVALENVDDALPVAADTPTLITFILNRYHDTHRAELQELVLLARKVERVHANDENCPIGLSAILEELLIDLNDHMIKEETVLFPVMLNADAMVMGPIAQMRFEHENHGEYIHRLEAVTSHLSLPGGACNSWRALYDGVAKLIEDLVAHIYIENRVLFPRFER
ncbi:iron-sulfur cluster repair di-iron protein [Thalassospira sp. MCCC 1A01428]|uniref:iron-sulfur cluster repair di-iron protein n=1 Tax=Thalassospira sp. MCCC 1A01428 TaxID=1470575 RepID=UPI000A1EFEFC|nr:iron-sulfur cluster repair di-iron protein [Thalassospira sp. MCCC 1A01428]